MCAAVAGQRGRRVALLEHNGQPGRKILISGGGRCNFTNLHCGPENFLSENKHVAKSALALYQPRHFIELVERYGIAWHEKTLGQLFCDGSAREIVRMLLAECAAGAVDVRVGHRVTGVSRGDTFRVETDHGAFSAPALALRAALLRIGAGAGARVRSLEAFLVLAAGGVEPAGEEVAERGDVGPQRQRLPELLLGARRPPGDAEQDAEVQVRVGVARQAGERLLLPPDEPGHAHGLKVSAGCAAAKAASKERASASIGLFQ